jgi:hypothetical protein
VAISLFLTERGEFVAIASILAVGLMAILLTLVPRIIGPARVRAIIHQGRRATSQTTLRWSIVLLLLLLVAAQRRGGTVPPGRTRLRPGRKLLVKAGLWARPAPRGNPAPHAKPTPRTTTAPPRPSSGPEAPLVCFPWMGKDLAGRPMISAGVGIALLAGPVRWGHRAGGRPLVVGYAGGRPGR